ncbi:MAG: hypothetical protein HY072_05120 [Deltaproteobacteria bacterium]|nr:hypothetical protein [Deltaproteobacteria bacterium]
MLERLLSALWNGSNPLIVNLHLQKLFVQAGSKYAAYMIGIAIGVSLALLFPKAERLTHLRLLILFTSTIPQAVLLSFCMTNFSIGAAATSSVFFQFLFYRISTANITAKSQEQKLGSVMSFLAQIEILAAVISHCGYAFMMNHFVSITSYSVNIVSSAVIVIIVVVIQRFFSKATSSKNIFLEAWK